MSTAPGDIERTIRTLLTQIGEDPDREGLRDTPARVAKSYAFLTGGYDEDVDALVGDAIFTEDVDEMVVVKDIEVYSLCEHHMLPFTGRCHVAYLPKGRVIGLSKLPRIVEVYARRLQLQERLTLQIAQAFERFRGVLDELLSARASGGTPTHVFVFGDEATFRPYNLRSRSKDPARFAGYCSSSPFANYIALDATPGSRFERVVIQRRFSVWPGLTCTWQISGRADLDFEEWLRLDLEYVDQWSFANDLKILLKTVPAVLFQRGAY